MGSVHDQVKSLKQHKTLKHSSFFLNVCEILESLGSLWGGRRRARANMHRNRWQNQGRGMISHSAKNSAKLETLVKLCESLERVGPFGGGPREGHTKMKKKTMVKVGRGHGLAQGLGFCVGRRFAPLTKPLKRKSKRFSACG